MPESDGNASQVRLVGALAGIGSGRSLYRVVAVQLNSLVIGLTKVKTPFPPPEFNLLNTDRLL